jgi:GDPmannose 4,6-dehydratase
MNHDNINDVNDKRFSFINLDITDQQSINNNIKTIRPDYVINFAAQSFVGESWNSPIQTFTTNTLSVMYLLEAIREYVPKCRFYSAGSSEEFGDVEYVPQDIKHPCKPRSPYGASKCAARHLTKVYRESYNLFAIHCILFNHEGIRRGKEFVTRKITSNIAGIKKKIQNGEPIVPFELGNIYAKRDWSDSEDFVEAVWLMLNMDHPREYVLSSNETHTVKEFIELACDSAELNYTWESGASEIDEKLIINGEIAMQISEKFYRPAEVDLLFGCSKETREVLNWEPKVNFNMLVDKMVKHDIKLLE